MGNKEIRILKKLSPFSRKETWKSLPSIKPIIKGLHNTLCLRLGICLQKPLLNEISSKHNKILQERYLILGYRIFFSFHNFLFCFWLSLIFPLLTETIFLIFQTVIRNLTKVQIKFLSTVLARTLLAVFSSQNLSLAFCYFAFFFNRFVPFSCNDPKYFI